MCSFIFFAMPIDATSHQNLNNLGQINSQKKKKEKKLLGMEQCTVEYGNLQRALSYMPDNLLTFLLKYY